MKNININNNVVSKNGIKVSAISDRFALAWIYSCVPYLEYENDLTLSDFKFRAVEKKPEKSIKVLKSEENFI